MTDELPPENQAPESPTSVPQPAPQQPVAPAIPAWVAARTDSCEYNYGAEKCPNKIDPNNPAFVDPTNGGKYCGAHSRECDNCSQQALSFKMTPFKEDSYYSNTEYYCENCYPEVFRECPNCKETVHKSQLLPPTRRNTYSMKKGGCKQCADTCYSCDRIIDKEDGNYIYQGDSYCEDCYSENFSYCEECNESYPRDDTRYVENVGDICDHCYNNKFTECSECEKVIEKDDAYDLGDDVFCEECYSEKGPEEWAEYTHQFKGFSYTKKDRYLNILSKMLPITVKDLKSKQPSLANGLSDLISFSKGKPITQEMVQAFRASQKPEEFPVKYTVWDGVQRSIDTLEQSPTDKPQLAINVLASTEMLNKLKSNPALYDLFDSINTISKKSTHPYVKDQIGWIRVEIDPNNEYLLVDEIQSDHSNAGYRLKHTQNDHEINKVRSALKHKYRLSDEDLNKLLEEYVSVLKDFPNIANQAVVKFANQNGIKRIFWHTYDSGMKLKDNSPPKSLYDKTPKENFFMPSPNKPFGLEGEFFEKEAQRADGLYKLARKLYVKWMRLVN